ncbi:hypothetical protein IE53DRAFT_383109 [Violaceomyces palustris]|uniref:Uncharacterized protein n=1 Tax=Violaceomyces palustris TaxID=1673888 RepID=A0ACD0P8F0_9BASI|nr:hypothetical protein IE53DRAFT_383109 [Violaceomyces palustris]
MSSIGKDLGKSQRPQYVIEHMEEDDPDAPSVFPKWALLEYRHMLDLVGPGSTVHFTSLSKASLESLRSLLTTSPSSSNAAARADFELHTSSITTLATERGIPLSKICLLDPKAKKALSVKDSGIHRKPSQPREEEEEEEETFDYYLFGGILGDDPPRDRTASLRQLGFPGRNLGSIQMTTDTALGVTKKVVEDGLWLNVPELIEQAQQDDVLDLELEKSLAKGKLEWVQYPELKFGKGESVEMPFRYMVDPNLSSSPSSPSPLMPPGMRELIKDDLNRSFEF